VSAFAKVIWCWDREITDLAKMIQAIAGSHSEVKFSPPLAGDIARSLADTTRARNELEYASRTPVEDGLSRIIQWLSRKLRKVS